MGKKKHEADRRDHFHAEICDHYGINPWQLTDDQAIYLHQRIPMFEARRLIKEFNIHGIELNAKGAKDLGTLAYDKATGEQMAYDVIRSRMERDNGQQ